MKYLYKLPLNYLDLLLQREFNLSPRIYKSTSLAIINIIYLIFSLLLNKTILNRRAGCLKVAFQVRPTYKNSTTRRGWCNWRFLCNSPRLVPKKVWYAPWDFVKWVDFLYIGLAIKNIKNCNESQLSSQTTIEKHIITARSLFWRNFS